MSDKLLPCPFCGGEACIQRHEFVGYTDTFGIVCLDCCCETRQFYDTEEEAAEAWNRRAEPKEPKEPERKRGKWRYYEGQLSCQVCGAEVDDISPFCPECGSDMRGDDDE